MKLASMHGKLASDVELNKVANQVGMQQTYMDADESFVSVWTAIRGIDQKLTTTGGQLASLRADFESFVDSFKKDTPTQLKRKSTDTCAYLTRLPHALPHSSDCAVLARRAGPSSSSEEPFSAPEEN